MIRTYKWYYNNNYNISGQIDNITTESTFSFSLFNINDD